MKPDFALGWYNHGLTLSLTAPVEMTEVLLWGGEGVARMPGGVDVAAAYAAAIDALLAGETPFDASFARDVVRVLVAADERLPDQAPPISFRSSGRGTSKGEESK